MAKILFCWEMGEGLGHLVPVRPVMERLVAEGHELIVAAVEVHSARRVLGHICNTIIQAPGVADARFPLGRSAEGPADLLTMNGFADSASLRGRHHAWCELARLFRPDLLIAEHSPGALLMARALGLPAVHLGTGFTLPPERSPMCYPGYPDATNLQRESEHVARFNALIEKDGGEPLPGLSSLFNAVARRYLLTFEELDHLGPREGVPYMGVALPSDGARPEWPQAGKQKLFAYLKPSPVLEAFLSAVNTLNLSLLMVPDRVDPAILKRHASDNIRIVTERQSMAAVLQQADLIVSNGNHGTAAAAMLGGVPSLAFPLHQEQVCCARRVAESGLGASLPGKNGKGLPALLARLLDSDTMRMTCQRSAERYASFDFEHSIVTMTRDIAGLL